MQNKRDDTSHSGQAAMTWSSVKVKPHKSKHVLPPIYVTPLKFFQEQSVSASSTNPCHAHGHHSEGPEEKIHIHLQEMNKAIEDMLMWIGYDATTCTSRTSSCSPSSSSYQTTGDSPKLDHLREKEKQQAPIAADDGYGNGIHENKRDIDDDELFSKLKEMCVRDEYVDFDDGLQSQITTSTRVSDVIHHEACTCTCLDSTPPDHDDRVSRMHTTSQIIPEGHHSEEIPSMEDDGQVPRSPMILRRAKTQTEVGSIALLERRRSQLLMARESYPYLV